MKKADAAFTHLTEKGGRVVAVLGGHGDLEVQTYCSPDGLALSAVAISGFRMVRVPRVWDSPERRAAEVDPAANSGGWREPSKRRLTTGLRVFARSRRGSGTPRRLLARRPPSPGSTTKRWRMMTAAARKPRTDAPARAREVLGCDLASYVCLRNNH